MSAVTDCPFCAIIAGDAPAMAVRRWDRALAIVPHRPVVPGHVLVIPHVHVADVGVDRAITAMTMACAADLAAGLEDANIITSKGRWATQSVWHLHAHVVPRHRGDELPLPWTPQQAAAAWIANAIAEADRERIVR